MNRTQLEHIIRAAGQISADTEIVVIGSQSIHALDTTLPDIAYLSQEADFSAANPRRPSRRATERRRLPSRSGQ